MPAEPATGPRVSNYTNVAIPNDLALMVDRIVDGGGLGFRSRQEFVIDAVRRHLLYVKGELAKRPAT